MVKHLSLICLVFSLLFSVDISFSEANQTNYQSSKLNSTPHPEVYIEGIVVETFDYTAIHGAYGIVVQTETQKIYVPNQNIPITASVIGSIFQNGCLGYSDYPILQIGDSVEAFGLLAGDNLVICLQENYYLRKVVQNKLPITLLDMMATVDAQVGLNFRECPSLTCDIITRLSYHSHWQILGQTPDHLWLALNANDVQGWVSADWVTIYNDLQDIPIIDNYEIPVKSSILPIKLKW